MLIHFTVSSFAVVRTVYFVMHGFISECILSDVCRLMVKNCQQFAALISIEKLLLFAALKIC